VLDARQVNFVLLVVLKLKRGVRYSRSSNLWATPAIQWGFHSNVSAIDYFMWSWLILNAMIHLWIYMFLTQMTRRCWPPSRWIGRRWDAANKQLSVLPLGDSIISVSDGKKIVCCSMPFYFFVIGHGLMFGKWKLKSWFPAFLERLERKYFTNLVDGYSSYVF
jgi:hypothetical protein